MSERRHTAVPLSLLDQDQQARQAASIPDPTSPGTGTTRISSLLAAARLREDEQRRADALASVRKAEALRL